jgi:hypothetical protein
MNENAFGEQILGRYNMECVSDSLRLLKLPLPHSKKALRSTIPE